MHKINISTNNRFILYIVFTHLTIDESIAHTVHTVLQEIKKYGLCTDHGCTTVFETQKHEEKV